MHEEKYPQQEKCPHPRMGWLSGCVPLAVCSLAPACTVHTEHPSLSLPACIDYLLGSSSRSYMPQLHRLIGDQGLQLTNFVVNMVCVPGAFAATSCCGDGAVPGACTPSQLS